MSARRPARLALLVSRPMAGALLGGSRTSAGRLVGEVQSRQKNRLRGVPVVVQ